MQKICDLIEPDTVYFYIYLHFLFILEQSGNIRGKSSCTEIITVNVFAAYIFWFCFVYYYYFCFVYFN